MKKNRLRSSRCADISRPTLRKVREGWGTPSGIYASEIKSRGSHLQKFSFETVTDERARPSGAWTGHPQSCYRRGKQNRRSGHSPHTHTFAENANVWGTRGQECPRYTANRLQFPFHDSRGSFFCEDQSRALHWCCARGRISRSAHGVPDDRAA